METKNSAEYEAAIVTVREAAEATADHAARRILRQAEMDSDGNGVVWNARMYLADRVRYARLQHRQESAAI